jgi:prohibitin 1
MYYKNV